MRASSTAEKRRQEEEIQWARSELGGAGLGDARLDVRLVSIVAAFLGAPEGSIPRSCGTWSAAKGAYRFFSNEKVEPEAIYECHRQSTLKRAREEKVVLAIGDTTQLDYTEHLEAEGLGPLGDLAHYGLLFQPVLIATPERVPLGIAGQKIWVRDRDDFGQSQTEKKRKRSIQKKESVKWLDSLAAAERFKLDLGSSETRVVAVFDREGDIFEVLAKARETGRKSELLVRASWDRRVDHPQKHLWAHMQAQAEVGSLTLTVPRGPGTKARQAVLSVRVAEVTVRRPQGREVDCDAKEVSIFCVYANEEAPPKCTEAVSWMLFTTVQTRSFQEACTIIEWYSTRWIIEILFRVLKSGCRAEERQLETAERLKRCLAVDVIVAWRILYLTTTGRQLPDLPCTAVFEEHEWKGVWAFVNRTTKVPEKPPSLQVIVRLIGGLGGHLGRKGDGQPGAMTLWRGLQRVPDIAGMWLLCRGSSS